ncbi:hypothetical protein NDU88_007571 [Pleurodeles waltl]|uniref:Uncharacterized protein n=1 Tax=Pleurodeles waltl TaxID=8319 RepID=A0AAV7QL14_PLEWA|nr:hypothetical protein NDU88_007571 [Pleurodeles waltl]
MCKRAAPLRPTNYPSFYTLEGVRDDTVTAGNEGEARKFGSDGLTLPKVGPRTGRQLRSESGMLRRCGQQLAHRMWHRDCSIAEPVRGRDTMHIENQPALTGSWRRARS